jgi:hypothetical protein
MAWPLSLSDLTTMNFFLWGHIKAPIYTSPVDSEAVPIAHIVQAAATLKQQPGSLGTHDLSVLYRCRWPYV